MECLIRVANGEQVLEIKKSKDTATDKALYFLTNVSSMINSIQDVMIWFI
jgi:hypothetical protein